MNSDVHVPSFSSLKKFRLPGFVEPTKVSTEVCRFFPDNITVFQYYTSDGIPFFINKPSDILRRCLGVPKIAESIVRFPVSTEHEMKWVCTSVASY